MKELIPCCPKCNTTKFVVRDRSAEKLGTVAGGITGAGSALAGSATGNTIGERIDTKIRMKYRCTHCGSEIQG